MRALRTIPLLALCLSLPRAVNAQRPPDEARAHFERAVTLYTDANFEAALVEFQRAFTLSQNANLLYNIGAAYESLGRFVEARDALEAYRMRGAAPTVAARAAELDARLARLRERIGTLRVLLDAPGLRVRVDGVEVPMDRARAGLAVSAGVRVIALDAEGYLPREERREVTGNQTVLLEEPLARARGSLDLRADVADATVRVDGVEIGRTPLAEPLSVEVGAHAVEVTRAGYAPWSQRVNVSTNGARVDVVLAWADPIPESESARISLRSNVSHPTLALDGRPIRDDGGQRVPPGPHVLRAERAGYVPMERRVVLDAGDNDIGLWLDATPALRAEHDARVRRARTPAYALLATGGALLAAGVPLLVTGAVDQAQGASALDAVNARLDLCGREPGRAGCTVNGNPIRTADLAPEASAAAAQRDDGGVRAVVGGVLTGLGVAGAVTGVVLFLRSGSLGGFDRPAGWSFELRRDGLGLRAVF